MATDPTSTPVPTPAAPGADEGFLHSVATSMGIDPDALKTAVKVIGTDPVGAAKAVGSEAVDELNEMVHNPVQTATTTGQGMLAAVTNPDAKATAMRHLKSPGLNQKIQGLNEYAASIIPFVGGNIVKSQEQAAQGNLAGSLGTVVGTVGPMVTDSEPVQAVKSHLGETGAQFVQGAKESLQRAATATAPEGSLEAGFAKIGGKKVKDGAPKPNYAYRARPVGQEGIGTESHAQATASSEEAQRYASDLENSTGQPHEVVKVDLNKVPTENYTRKAGPNGNDWVKFHEPVDESVVEKSGLKPDFSALGSKTVKDAEPSLGPQGIHTQQGADQLVNHLKTVSPGADFEVVGGVKTRGTSTNDLDLLVHSDAEDVNGVYDHEKTQAEMEKLGFEYQGRHTVSPSEAAASDKKLAKGWSDVEHFVNPQTGHTVEMWFPQGESPELPKPTESSLPEKTPFEGRHFSRVERDDNILGGERGAAAAGEEKARLQHDNKVPGVYAYREGATPEPQIGSRAYQYEIKGNKAIADISEGGNGHELLQGTVTKKQAEYEAAGDNATIAFQKALNDGEAALRDAGYDGYERGDGSVFLFGDQKPTGKFVNHTGAAVRVPLNEAPEVSPNLILQASAQKYAKTQDMPEINHAAVPLDADRAREIAKAYDEAEHTPNDPRTKASFDALNSETKAQWNHAVNDLGITFEPTEKDPYKNVGEMMQDVRDNKRLKIYTGAQVTGDHPGAKIDPDTGLSYNVMFRGVHDLFGHAAGGHDFSEAGEKSATESHAQMYSGVARPAMRSLTEGQTSWFFHNPEVEAGAAQPGKFAEQKATLLPEKFETVGRNFVESDPKTYQAALANNPQAATLSDMHPDAKIYQMQENGKPVQVFYSINPDGEIAGVVNNTGGAVKGAAADVFKDAATKGGKYLTAWDVKGKLPALYKKQGFEITSRTPYDAKTYGPPSKELQASWQSSGWNGKQPYPDVVRMEPKISPLTPSTGGTPEAPAAPPEPKESESLPLVSSRVPSKTVKGETIADHTNSALTSDMQAAAAAPGFLQKLADRVGPTPGFKDPGGDAATRTNAYIRHIADNVKFVWDKLKPEDIKKDEQWYPVGAHQRGIEVAQKHGIDPHQAYAITAALSPLTDWDVNTSLAERAVDVWKNQQNTKFTPQMKAAAQEILSIPAMKKFAPQLKKLEGKTLGELPKVKDQAWWLRLYDEGHNPREYQTWSPDGTSGGLAKNMDGSPKQVSWSFQNLIENAIHIMKDGSQENISKVLGGAHKIRNFYNNQLAPNDPRFLTIDTHAVAAGQLRPMSGKTYEVRMNFGGTSNKPYGLKGTYALHDAGYRLAANELGVTIPSRVQSPTWVKIRELFPNRFKTPENQEAIDAIWKEHTNGKITADEARNKIWDYAEGWNTRNAGGTGATADQRELFDTGVRGETSEGTSGRGNRGNAAPTTPEVEDEDTSFDFGANVKPAPKRASKVSATQKAKNDAMAKGIAGLIRSGKK